MEDPSPKPIEERRAPSAAARGRSGHAVASPLESAKPQGRPDLSAVRESEEGGITRPPCALGGCATHRTNHRFPPARSQARRGVVPRHERRLAGRDCQGAGTPHARHGGAVLAPVRWSHRGDGAEAGCPAGSRETRGIALSRWKRLATGQRAGWMLGDQPHARTSKEQKISMVSCQALKRLISVNVKLLLPPRQSQGNSQLISGRPARRLPLRLAARPWSDTGRARLRPAPAVDTRLGSRHRCGTGVNARECVHPVLFRAVGASRHDLG